jgi:uncharacterized protein with von Willebrand factor type A (vWA) domain
MNYNMCTCLFYSGLAFLGEDEHRSSQTKSRPLYAGTSLTIIAIANDLYLPYYMQHILYIYHHVYWNSKRIAVEEDANKKKLYSEWYSAVLEICNAVSNTSHQQ